MSLRAAQPGARETMRLEGLDGLRGLAALVVVIHHAMQASPPSPYGPLGEPGLEGVAWWFSEISIFFTYWAGRAAVYVFFVLSGFVLALQFVRGPAPAWRAYYPSRLLRLYLPVWAAVLFATALILVFPREASDGQSQWLADHATSVTAGTLLGDATLANPSVHNSPLWSLKYEVAFSLLLPAYLFIGRRITRWWAALAAVAALLVACELGVVLVNDWFMYMPMFAFGVLLALRHDQIRAAAASLPRVLWAALALGAVALLTSQQITGAGLHATPLVLLGAVLTVVLFMHWAPAVALGSAPPVRFLGTVSFSLYLTHEPVVVAAAFLFPDWSAAEMMPLTLPLTVVVAWGFFRALEAPAHRLSKRVRRHMEPGSGVSPPTRSRSPMGS